MALPSRTFALAAVGLQACAFWGMSDWSANEGADGASADADPDVHAVHDGGDHANAPPDAPPVPVLARDTFSRTVANGLGTADVGGAWTVSGRGGVSVTGGTAVMNLLAPGDGPWALLPDVVTADADVELLFASEQLGSGTGLYLTVIARHIERDHFYAASYVLDGEGRLHGRMSRKTQAAGEEVVARAPAVLTVVPDQAFRVRVQVTGLAPTHLRSKIWNAGGVEPEAWPIDTVDSTPSLQAAGSTGMDLYLSSAATNTPFSVRADDFLVRPASLVR
jgi:hypothetical protein